MKYEIIITDEADGDIEAAADWYEEKQSGLGKKFVLSIKACLKMILRNPLSFATIYLKFRKANTKKFPYSLYYQVDELKQLIIVFAVIHSSRDEKAWQKRISNENL